MSTISQTENSLFVTLPVNCPYTSKYLKEGVDPETLPKNYYEIIAAGIEAVPYAVRLDEIVTIWPHSEKYTILELRRGAYLVEMPFKEVYRRVNIPKKVNFEMNPGDDDAF
jgi:hypothetical protein